MEPRQAGEDLKREGRVLSGLEFVNDSHDLSLAMTGTFRPSLVLTSVLVATLAAYSALLTTERVRSAESRLARWIWFVTGSVAMGGGVWTTHFVGMLAYEMGMTVSYNLASHSSRSFLESPPARSRCTTCGVPSPDSGGSTPAAS